MALFSALLLITQSARSMQKTGPEQVRLLAQTGRELRLVVQLAREDIKLTSLRDGEGQRLEISGFGLYGNAGDVPLPQRGLPLALPPETAPEISFQAGDFQRIPVQEPYSIPEAGVKKSRGRRIKPASAPGKEPVYVKLVQTGWAGGRYLAILRVAPAFYDARERAFIVARRIEITVKIPAPVMRRTPQNVPPVDTLLAKKVLNSDMAQRWSGVGPASAANPASPVAAQLEPRVRVVVNKDGWYRVSGQMLADAGLDLIGRDPRGLRVSYWGTEQPIFVTGARDQSFDPQDAIIFRGEVNHGKKSYLSPYSEENVYLISYGPVPGLRMAEVDGGLYVHDKTAPENFVQTRHFEKDYFFDRLLLEPDNEADHWFWDMFTAGEEQQFTFQLQQPLAAGDSARLTVAFRGITHPPATNPDHSAEIRLNETHLAAVQWDGQAEFVVANLGVPPGLLKNGANRLKINAPGDSPAGGIDSFYLNWFEISYPRAFRAKSDSLQFIAESVSGVAEFSIGGFSTSEILLFDHRGRRFTNFWTVRDQDGTFRLKFQDTQARAGTVYDAMTKSHPADPLRLELDQPSDLRAASNAADYIIISPPEFLDGIRPLAEHRRSRGLRVVVVNAQDIYDEFSGGNYEPEAIKKFLSHAYHFWQRPAPKYVLLVGDTQWRFHKPTSAELRLKSWLPTYMAYTISWGITSSDNYFVSVAGNDIMPDMCIGRLPCNDQDQLEAMVNKIIDYETSSEPGRWRAELTLAVGWLTDFERHAETINNDNIPKTMKVDRVYANPGTRYYGDSEELLAKFNDGAAIMNFIGHGGGGVFTDSSLFVLDDAPKLRNQGKLPVLLAWACFIGYFDNPFSPSLGETLFAMAQNGVAATFGSAGRAWLFGDFLFNSVLFDVIFKEKERTLGEIIRRAKIELLMNYGGYQDLVINYNLLGDPAMRLAIPLQEHTLLLPEEAVHAGDSLIVQGSTGGINSGSARVEAYVYDDSLITGRTVPVTGGTFQTSLALPGGLSGEGLVRTYVSGDGKEAVGAAKFAIDAAFVADIVPTPANPVHQQVHRLRATLSPTKGAVIDSVLLLWNYGSRVLSQRMRMLPETGGRYHSAGTFQAAGGTLIFYRLQIFENRQGARKTTLTPIRSYRILRKADLSFLSSNLLVGGTDQAEFRIGVTNYGDLPVPDFNVALYSGNWPNGGNPPLASASVTALQPFDTAAVQLNWASPAPGERVLSLVIDPQARLDESFRGNNVLLRQFKFATAAAGTAGEFFYSSDSSVAVRVPAGALAQTADLDINRFQWGLTPGSELPAGIRTLRLQHGTFYRVNAHADTLRLAGKIHVRLVYDQSESIDRSALRVLLFDEASRTWHTLPATLNRNAGFVSADLPAAGVVGLGHLLDTTPPEIAVKLAGQAFANGDFVSLSPEFSIVLSDNTGFVDALTALEIKLDGREVRPEDIVISASDGETDMLLANYAPVLQPGEHRLHLRAQDRFGNAAQREMRLTASGQFALLGIANHPNPFQQETVIAYTLSDEATEINLKIYTVAGRLVRQWARFNEIGYQELVWDGRDELGQEVPNGVYYLRFVARQGEKVIERIEKLARLQ